jgi:hypothetical protein
MGQARPERRAGRTRALRRPLKALQSPPAEDPDRIVAERTSLLAELERLRRTRGPSRLADNAQTLLTRSWSPAGWAGRQRLLATAGWLLRLAWAAAGAVPPR